MARPKSSVETLKVLQINIRFTLNEKLYLEETAKIYGLSVIGFIRRKSLQHQMPKYKMSGIDRDLIIELSRIGNNINQLTKKANQTNKCDIDELEGMLYFLKDQLGKIISIILKY